MEDLKQLLKSTTLQKLIESKRKVVEVAYTATVAETMRVMRENGVSVVAVASPPAGSFHYDPTETGTRVDIDGLSEWKGPALHDAIAPLEWYVGVASTFDIFTYFAKLLSKTRDPGILPQLFLDSPVYRCIKGHTLYMLSPNSSVLEVIDKMINGMHSALVPHIDSQRMRCDGETGYSMITQTDIIEFFQAESEKFKPILRYSVESLQAYQPRVLGVLGNMPMLDAVRCMHEASLSVVPILEGDEHETSKELTPAKGKVLVGSFSASDIKRCSMDVLGKWGEEGLLSFLKRAIILEMSQCSVDTLEADANVMHHVDLIGSFTRFEHVICTLDMSLQDVISSALENDVHHVWVIEKDDKLLGLISFIDIFRAVRRCINGCCD